MTPPQSLSAFEGRWSLTRTIHDSRARQVAQADGFARFQPDAGGLIYDEEVTLRIPGQPAMKGTRRYMWRDDGDRISVHFDDGRYFHGLSLATAKVSDHHDCPPDSYDAMYDFSSWPRWSVRWTVSGPRKDYQMDTEFSRL